MIPPNAHAPTTSVFMNPPRVAFSDSSAGREASSVRSAPGSPRVSESAIRLLFCDQGTCCGLFDEMSDGPRLRHIHSVAAFDFDDR